MKHQRVRIATAIAAAAVLAGCFDDPTSSLRNGPAELRLSRTSVIVPVADSVLVEANVVDDQGNILTAEGATWTTADPAVATVDLAASQLPANGSSRAYIKGIAALGGITTVRVTIRGVTDSVRVVALPNTVFGVAGLASVTGPLTPDTTGAGIVGGCIGADSIHCFMAGDTLIVRAAPGTEFDLAGSVVQLGGLGTMLLKRTADTLKVLANRGHRGPVTVTNVIWHGDATTGDIVLPSVETPDSAIVSRARMRGTTVVSNSALGPATEMVVTAGPGTSFTLPTTLPADTSFVLVGGVRSTILRRSPAGDSIYVIAPVGDTSSVRVTKVKFARAPGDTVMLDSLVSGAAIIINAGYVPATIATGTDLLDTIFVTANAGVTFATSAQVSINGATAYMVSRSSTVLKVIPANHGLGVISVTGVIGPVWGTLPGRNPYPALPTPTPYLVNNQITAEANEPNNDVSTSGTAFTGPTNVNDTVTVVGAIDMSTDLSDYWAFTAVNSGQHRFVIDWFPTTVDIDATVRNGTTNANLSGGAAAGSAVPEVANVTLTGGSPYRVRIDMYDAHGALTPMTYRLRVIRIN